MTFGEKIQKLRKEAGLSQEELSYQLEVSRQAVRGVTAYSAVTHIINAGKPYPPIPPQPHAAVALLFQALPESLHPPF